MKLKQVSLILGLAAASLQASAQCYTVYDRANTIVYQGQQAPVDMSQPVEPAIERLVPGGHLLLAEATPACADVGVVPVAVPTRVFSGEPDTARMGAGPATPASQPVGTPPERVITELKNPPIRVSRDARGQLVFEQIHR